MEDQNEVIDEPTKITVQFTTKLPQKYKISSTPIHLPEKLTRYGLSEVINHLLNFDPPVPFDFILGGEFIRTTLKKHREKKELSEETTLDIEYVKAAFKPDDEKDSDHDDWISSIDTKIPGFFCTGSYDSKVRVWDDKGNLFAISDQLHSAPIKDVTTISPKEESDSFHLISCSNDMSIISWEVGKRTSKLTPKSKFIGHTAPILSIDSHNNKFCSSGDDGLIKIWDLAQEETEEKSEKHVNKKAKIEKIKNITESLTTINAHKQSITSIKWFNPDRIVSGSHDYSIKIWDVGSGTEALTLNGNKAILSLDYSKPNGLFATGHSDNIIRLWDYRVSEGQIVKNSFSSHKGWVYSVAWHPISENYLLSGSYDNSVKLWDIRSSTPLYSLTTHTDKVLSVNWNLLETESSEKETVILSGSADCKLKIFAQ